MTFSQRIRHLIGQGWRDCEIADLLHTTIGVKKQTVCGIASRERRWARDPSSKAKALATDRARNEKNRRRNGAKPSETLHFDQKYTPKADALIRSNYGKLSAAEIARQIGCTRNAVIGRARRLGLSARP